MVFPTRPVSAVRALAVGPGSSVQLAGLPLQPTGKRVAGLVGFFKLGLLFVQIQSGVVLTRRSNLRLAFAIKR